MYFELFAKIYIVFICSLSLIITCFIYVVNKDNKVKKERAKKSFKNNKFATYI